MFQLFMFNCRKYANLLVLILMDYSLGLLNYFLKVALQHYFFLVIMLVLVFIEAPTIL